MSVDVQGLATDLPLWVSVDQEGGRVARLKAPFTEWPPMAVLGRSGDVQLAEPVRDGVGHRAEGGGHHARLRARPRHPHQPEEPGDRRSRTGRGRRERRPPWGRHHPRAAGQRRRGVRQAFSGSRRHVSGFASRAAARRASTRPDPACRVRSVSRGDPRRGRLHHDGARAGAVVRRGEAGDAVAADRAGAPARGARLPGRDSERRPGDEGDRQDVTPFPMRPWKRSRPGATAFSSAAATSMSRPRPSKRSFMPSRSRKFPTSASRTPSRGCAGPRSASSRLPSSPGRWRASGRYSAATRTSASSTRWQDICDVRKPRALKPGDQIAIVAPASPFSRDEFARGVAEIERLGFAPVFDDSVFAKESGYLAGSPELRAASFTKHWTDPAVSALLAVRGGYGSVHLLPLLDRARMVEQPKLFIGYSDNTSLLSWLTCQCGITALHGPMIEGRLAGGAGYDRAVVPRAARRRAAAGAGARMSHRASRWGSEGPAVRRHDHAACGLAGNSVRVRSARTGACSFSRMSTSVPYRIDRMLDAAPAERRAGAGPGDRLRRDARM